MSGKSESIQFTVTIPSSKIRDLRVEAVHNEKKKELSLVIFGDLNKIHTVDVMNRLSSIMEVFHRVKLKGALVTDANRYKLVGVLYTAGKQDNNDQE